MLLLELLLTLLLLSPLVMMLLLVLLLILLLLLLLPFGMMLLELLLTLLQLPLVLLREELEGGWRGKEGVATMAMEAPKMFLCDDGGGEQKLHRGALQDTLNLPSKKNES